MKNESEEKVAHFLHEKVFSRLGVPREIVTGQGP